MKTYSFRGPFTTVADIAKELGETRNQVSRWLDRFAIPHKNVIQGENKSAVTLVSCKYVEPLRAIAQHKRRLPPRSHAAATE